MKLRQEASTEASCYLLLFDFSVEPDDDDFDDDDLEDDVVVDLDDDVFDDEDLALPPEELLLPCEADDDELLAGVLTDFD